MIKIITDSVASIPADEARDAGIEIVTLYVNRDGVEYADAAMDLDAFYADIYDMVDDIPTSSQPSPLVLEELFEDVGRLRRCGARSARREGAQPGLLLRHHRFLLVRL